MVIFYDVHDFSPYILSKKGPTFSCEAGWVYVKSEWNKYQFFKQLSYLAVIGRYILKIWQ
jgi:hypothetical protein